MWVETWRIRYDKLTKQNVSRVSRKKALPTKHSQKPAVTFCHDSSHSSHVLSTCFTSREGFSRATRKNTFESSHSFSHTNLTMKAHIKYKVQKIEQNYGKLLCTPGVP